MMKWVFPIGQDVIKTLIPHRDPMLFVDRVMSLSDNKITIESDINPEAEFFRGHFPNQPIMPGVLIIETVAQAGALLISMAHGLEFDEFIAFTGVDEVKFRQPVYPNETMRVDVEIVKSRGPFYKFDGIASIDQRKVTSLKFNASKMKYKTED